MNQFCIFILGAITYFAAAPYLSAQMRNSLPDQATIAASITTGELQRHAEVLASDILEGRETGTEGQRKAAEYIAELFESWGLPKVGDQNSHLQKIFLKSEAWKQTGLMIKGKKFRHLWDFYADPGLNPDSNQDFKFDEVIFLGYGIDAQSYSDYRGVDVKGKAILIYDGEPLNLEGNSLVTGNATPSDWTIARRLQAAKARGASIVLVIDGKFKENVGELRRRLNSNSLKPAENNPEKVPLASCIHLSSETAKELLGNKVQKMIKQRDKILSSGRSASFAIKTNFNIILEKEIRTLSGHNVLGYVEGIDPALRHELLVVSAHFDHLGKRGDVIYYGADDNASGTSTVLEIAQAFREAQLAGAGPRRSVLFLLVSGEEKGLLGSQYYISNPVFPLENTIANINVDMVGRVDEKHAENPDYIYVIGADRISTELHRINEAANATFTGIELDYTYNDPKDPNRYYYRSDHYHFAEKGIPAVFYFSGTHADYHQPGDTADKLNYEKMAKIGRLVFHTAWELTNRDERIKPDVNQR